MPGQEKSWFDWRWVAEKVVSWGVSAAFPTALGKMREAAKSKVELGTKNDLPAVSLNGHAQGAVVNFIEELFSPEASEGKLKGLIEEVVKHLHSEAKVTGRDNLLFSALDNPGVIDSLIKGLTSSVKNLQPAERMQLFGILQTEIPEAIIRNFDGGPMLNFILGALDTIKCTQLPVSLLHGIASLSGDKDIIEAASPCEKEPPSKPSASFEQTLDCFINVASTLKDNLFHREVRTISYKNEENVSSQFALAVPKGFEGFFSSKEEADNVLVDLYKNFAKDYQGTTLKAFAIWRQNIAALAKQNPEIQEEVNHYTKVNYTLGDDGRILCQLVNDEGHPSKHPLLTFPLNFTAGGAIQSTPIWAKLPIFSILTEDNFPLVASLISHLPGFLHATLASKIESNPEKFQENTKILMECKDVWKNMIPLMHKWQFGEAFNVEDYKVIFGILKNEKLNGFFQSFVSQAINDIPAADQKEGENSPILSAALKFVPADMQPLFINALKPDSAERALIGQIMGLFPKLAENLEPKEVIGSQQKISTQKILEKLTDSTLKGQNIQQKLLSLVFKSKTENPLNEIEEAVRPVKAKPMSPIMRGMLVAFGVITAPLWTPIAAFFIGASSLTQHIVKSILAKKTSLKPETLDKLFSVWKSLAPSDQEALLKVIPQLLGMSKDSLLTRGFAFVTNRILVAGETPAQESKNPFLTPEDVKWIVDVGRDVLNAKPGEQSEKIMEIAQSLPEHSQSIKHVLGLARSTLPGIKDLCKTEEIQNLIKSNLQDILTPEAVDFTAKAMSDDKTYACASEVLTVLETHTSTLVIAVPPLCVQPIDTSILLALVSANPGYINCVNDLLKATTPLL